ncbi:GNAT family N-acetyltransferase [Saliphagus sp. GCM10025317]
MAVHRRHRGRGIGTDLLEAALEQAGVLTANFDADVRPFYESLGFDVESITEGRYRGVKRRSGARHNG